MIGSVFKVEGSVFFLFHPFWFKFLFPAVCMDGTFHKFLFAKDGTCNREGFEQFLNVTEDQEFWNSYK